MGKARIYWSKTNGLITLQPGRFVSTQFDGTGALKPALQASLRSFAPIVVYDADSYSSQIDHRLILAGSGSERNLLAFNPNSNKVTKLPIVVGNLPFVWDGGALFGRVRNESRAKGHWLEVFEWSTEKWRSLAVPEVSADTQLLVLRRLSSGKLEIIVFVPGYGERQDRIATWQENHAVFQTVVEDSMSQIMVSNSRGAIYGYIDMLGRYHYVHDWPVPAWQVTWLDRFSKLSGPISFDFINAGNAALIKSHDGRHAPSIRIFATVHGQPTQLYSSCENIDRGVNRVVRSATDYLFIPEKPKKQLVIYLHGGPINRIEADGSWLSDIFTLKGYPVLAVNYTGSIGNYLQKEERRNIADVFGEEIAKGKIFAERYLGQKFARPIVVADSFGSLVGLSAIATRHIHPSLFVDISAVVVPETVLAGKKPPTSRYLHTFFTKVVSDLHGKLSARNLISSSPRTQYLFLHGEDDMTTPGSDVRNFVEQINVICKVRCAKFELVPEMFHVPEAPEQFRIMQTGMSLALSKRFK